MKDKAPVAASQILRSLARAGSDQQQRLLLRVQGAYYLLSAVWPLVSIGSFQAVTGRKTDLWLVKTVAVLVGVIGGVLLWSGRRGDRPAPEAVALARGSAAGLAAIETAYVARRRISPVYLLDAVAEVALLAAYAHAWWHGRPQPPAA
jgi:hypothetical protein